MNYGEKKKKAVIDLSCIAKYDKNKVQKISQRTISI